ncbi:hypothetical protein KA005_31695 [bacterium]|nr:hypothetical protein [bacterium]
MVPGILLFSPFEKAFVKQHTRKGKTVGPYFTKRQVKVAVVKHTKKTRLDLDSKHAKKKIEALHAKKEHHNIHIEAAKVLKEEVEKHKSGGNTHYKIGKQEHHVDKLLSDLKDHIDHHSNEKESHENHIQKIQDRHQTEAKYWDKKRVVAKPKREKTVADTGEKSGIRIEESKSGKYDFYYPNRGEIGVYKDRSKKEILEIIKRRGIDNDVPDYKKTLAAEYEKINAVEKEKLKGEIPAGDIRKLKYKIISKGRKYFKAKDIAKGYSAQIVINEQSKDFSPGEEYSFDGALDIQRSKYGTKVTVTPVDSKTKEKMLSKVDSAELEKWFGYVESAADKGYVYTKGVDQLKNLNIGKDPELKSRLDKILSSVKAKKHHKTAEQYLGYISDNLDKYWYKNGEAKVLSAISDMKKLGEDTSGYEKKLKDLKRKFSPEEKQEKKKYSVKKQARPKQYSDYTIPELRQKEVEYDNIYNEGGEGYNPYREESEKRFFESERERPKTKDEQRYSLLKELSIQESTTFKESGMYDQKKVDKLRGELESLKHEEQQDLKDKWPKEKTVERRKEWNDLIRKLSGEDGNLSREAIKKIHEKEIEQGWQGKELKDAVKMHGIK